MIFELREHNLCNRSIAHTLDGCFLIAHLLIGEAAQAEQAVMEAIDLWDPDEEGENQLLQLTLRTAIKTYTVISRSGLNEECCADSSLPIELRRVSELPPDLRRCFVLRILAGLSSEVCAQILHFGVRQVDQYCCDAMKSLTALTYLKA